MIGARRGAGSAALLAAMFTLPQLLMAADDAGGLATTPSSAIVAKPEGAAGSRSFNAGLGASSVFFGGSFGLAFGDVDYVEIAPQVGVWLTPTASVGASLIYRYRNDDRYGDSLSTSDYGGSVFGNYVIWNPIYLHGEVEYLSYEYVQFGGSTERDDFTSVFVGGGAAFPMGRRTSAYVQALYNLSYSSGEPSPYSSPWVFRFGIGVGF